MNVEVCVISFSLVFDNTGKVFRIHSSLCLSLQVPLTQWPSFVPPEGWLSQTVTTTNLSASFWKLLLLGHGSG